MYTYIYIYIYIHLYISSLSRLALFITIGSDSTWPPDSTDKVGDVVSPYVHKDTKTCTGLIVLYSRFFTCSNPNVDRCSSPLPWDPY